MKGFKGFDKDLKCRDQQYVVGETIMFNGEPLLCSAGLHFVEHPLDALSYYKPNDGSRYAEIEADGVTNQKKEDSKRVATSLTVRTEIKIPSLVRAAVQFVFDQVKPSAGYSAHSATTGYSAHSATTGDYAHSATTGNGAHSVTTGESAHSATTGNSAHSATTGNSAHSATTGDSAHSATTGESAHSATTGNYAHSATTGNSAHSSVKGHGVIAASLGREGQAKAPKGSWLILAEYRNGEPHVKSVGVAWVDGEKIKANTFYTLKNGQFAEAEK